MVDNGLVVLQNCTGLVKSDRGSCSDGCVTSYDDDDDDENQVIDIEIEVETDEVLQKPLAMSFPSINSEHEVSFVCVHY
jgi:hypothetical protein